MSLIPLKHAEVDWRLQMSLNWKSSHGIFLTRAKEPGSLVGTEGFIDVRRDASEKQFNISELLLISAFLIPIG